jgi:hypothetical protein
VRIGFLLPREIAPFVRNGEHGARIYVLRGFAQIVHGSTVEAFREAEKFFRDVASGRPAFTVLAVITATDDPRSFYRNLTVVNGALVVSGAAIEPTVYGGN